MSSIFFLGVCQKVLSAEEEDDDLGGEDAQEHGQRIDRRVAQSGSLLGADAVRVGEGRRVGVGTGYHSRQGEVVELVAYAGNGTYDENRDDCNEEAREDVE